MDMNFQVDSLLALSLVFDKWSVIAISTCSHVVCGDLHSFSFHSPHSLCGLENWIFTDYPNAALNKTLLTHCISLVLL